jgi:hypothetical protein
VLDNCAEGTREDAQDCTGITAASSKSSADRDTLVKSDVTADWGLLKIKRTPKGVKGTHCKVSLKSFV